MRYRLKWIAARCAALGAGCVLSFGSGCAGHHVQVLFSSEKGDVYDCEPTTDRSIKCRSAGTIDPTDLNRDGTVRFRLPTECHGSYQQITIHDADTSHPRMIVTCAPLEAPIR
jgi:hypothetical protein